MASGARVLQALRSADPLESSLRLLQPEVHTHVLIHPRRGCQVLARLSDVAGPPSKRSQAEVAVGDERAHAELLGECHRFAIVSFAAFLAARQRGVTGKAEGGGLGPPSPEPVA